MANTKSIDRLETTDSNLKVWFSGATLPLVVPWFWVRDHSQDPSAVDVHTGQRTVDTFGLDRDIQATSAKQVGDEIRVDWSDGSPTSVLTEALLGSLDQAGPLSAAASHYPATMWRSAAEVAINKVPYADLAAERSGLGDLLTDVGRYGFGVVTDAQADTEGTEAMAAAIGYVRRTIFGDVWALSSDLTDHADSAYGQTSLEPHTDGSYSHDGPGIQLFVCAERTGTGGESVLVDGFAAAESLRDTDPDAFELLSTVAVPAHYREPGVDLRAARPTIRLEGDTVVQVTFNNYDRSPFLLKPTKMLAWYRAYSAFHDLITDELSWWIGRLEPGDALIFDNWRCLHGRLAYTGRRSFFGCYLNHEDLESRLRTNAATA